MFWQDSDQVLQHAVQHPAQPRAGAARRAAAAAAEPPALQRHARRRAGDRSAPCAKRGKRSAPPCAGCSPASRRRPRATTATIEKPAADESAAESSLISQFLGGVEIIPEKADAARRGRLRLVEPRVRGARGDHARGRVHAAEHRPAPRDHQQEPAVARRRGGQAGEEGHRSRDGDVELSGAAERALARRSPEHRRLAPEHAERYGDARAHDAPAEGSQLQPGEVGRSRRATRPMPSRSSRPTRG